MKLFFSFLLLFSFINRNTAQVIKGTYAIKNVQTGMVLRIKDANSTNGTPIVAYTPGNWKCITWDFKNTGENTYRLKNLFSGKTLQPKSTAAAAVALEEQPLVANNSLQEYEFITTVENRYYIKLKGTDLYLTPADKNDAVNSAIILSKKEETKLQQWTIHEQKPEI